MSFISFKRLTRVPQILLRMYGRMLQRTVYSQATLGWTTTATGRSAATDAPASAGNFGSQIYTSFSLASPSGGNLRRVGAGPLQFGIEQ